MDAEQYSSSEGDEGCEDGVGSGITEEVGSPVALTDIKPMSEDDGEAGDLATSASCWGADYDDDDDDDEGEVSDEVSSIDRTRYARSMYCPSEVSTVFFERPLTIRERVNNFLSWKPVALFFLMLILLSTLTFLLETMPALSSHPDYGDPNRKCYWFLTETIFIAFFTFEYVIRWAFAKNIFSFPFDFFNIIDIMAILPYYVELIVSQGENPCLPVDEDAENGSSLVDLRFIRLIRLARVFRVLKLSRKASATTVLVTTFRNAKHALMVPFFFLMLGLIVFASLIYLAEQGDYDIEDGRYYITDSQGHRTETVFISIPDSLWWAIVTMTTVGYGDMYPKGHAGKAVNSVAMVFGTLFFAMPIAIVGNEFKKAWDEKIKRDNEAKVKTIAYKDEKSRLASDTKNWGERELQHFRLYFTEEYCSLEEFMDLTKEEKAAQDKKIVPAEVLVPEHFNKDLFAGGWKNKARRIARNLSVSHCFIRSPELPSLNGEYRMQRKKCNRHVCWENSSLQSTLFSDGTHWVVSSRTSPFLKSAEPHAGNLPGFKTVWTVVDDNDNITPAPGTRLATEKKSLVIKKEACTYIDGLDFEEDADGMISLVKVQSKFANKEVAAAFVGRKLRGYCSVNSLMQCTYPLSEVQLSFYPRFGADRSLVDLAMNVFHVLRTQDKHAQSGEKNCHMYTKDFISQLYLHIGFGRLPTGIRSKAGLKITCGSTESETLDFTFNSDSHLGVYGLVPGRVVPVYCIGNQARILNDNEMRGSIGGELLSLAQNFYLNSNRSTAQRVFLVTYRGTDVRFYTAYFPPSYLEAIIRGVKPVEEGLQEIEIRSFPNRPEGGHLHGFDPVHTMKKGREDEIGVKHARLPPELEKVKAGLKPPKRVTKLTTLTLPTESDSLNFLNPHERRVCLELLQRLRLRLIKYLKEDLNDNLAFISLASPRDDFAGSMASRQQSQLLGSRDVNLKVESPLSLRKINRGSWVKTTGEGQAFKGRRQSSFLGDGMNVKTSRMSNPLKNLDIPSLGDASSVTVRSPQNSRSSRQVARQASVIKKKTGIDPESPASPAGSSGLRVRAMTAIGRSSQPLVFSSASRESGNAGLDPPTATRHFSEIGNRAESVLSVDSLQIATSSFKRAESTRSQSPHIYHDPLDISPGLSNPSHSSPPFRSVTMTSGGRLAGSRSAGVLSNSTEAFSNLRQASEVLSEGIRSPTIRDSGNFSTDFSEIEHSLARTASLSPPGPCPSTPPIVSPTFVIN